jgi:predicted amidohydrolase
MQSMQNNDKIRFGGAQIPVTADISKNITTIKKAIDWAAENNVDYLVTPEASLSGYSPSFNSIPENLIYALEHIESYAAEKKVGLCLGTLWMEEEFNGKQVRNQIRFYDCDNHWIGSVNKNITIEEDKAANVLRDPVTKGLFLPIGDKVIPTGGLICVDMYGSVGTVDSVPNIPAKLAFYGAKLFVHSTNGTRGAWINNPLKEEFGESIQDLWHDACFKRNSFIHNIPIITVDNCYMTDGTEYHGNTSSQSGVLIRGKWMTNVPRCGTQYFYYDFNVEDIAISMPNRPSV